MAPSPKEFRFAYFTRAYERTVAFYSAGLELAIRDSWDRSEGDRGTVFEAASGLIEVLDWPNDEIRAHLWDPAPPHGAFVVVETEDVDARYARAVRSGLPLIRPLETKPWGHRAFCVEDPNGVVLLIYASDEGSAGG